MTPTLRLPRASLLCLAAATAFIAAIACGGANDRPSRPPERPNASIVPNRPSPEPAVATGAANPTAAFLDAVPVIDGIPDASIGDLPARALTLMTGQPRANERPPSFRVAYTARHLYLLVELDVDRIEQRDRAYQNGDGLIVVIARPRPNNAPTEEFDVLGFSPKTAARWQQRFVWYRNVGLEFRDLDEAQVATGSAGGRSFFEVLIPWREVYPFHPWLTEDGIGFNLCVTRALPDNASARYCLVEDGRVDSEQNPRRYRPLSFAAPRTAVGTETTAILDRNTIHQGSGVRLQVATFAPAASQMAVTASVLSGEGTRVASRETSLELPAGLKRHDVDVPASGLRPGGYTVSWETADGSSTGRVGLTVLAAPDASALRSRLAAVARRIRPGSLTTLQFQVDDAERQEKQLLPHDVAASLRVAIDQLVADVAAAEAGLDLTATRAGLMRRAYRSRVDGTLQPYSLRVPTDYNRRATYPLLVYLHGSGEDDRNQLTRDWLPRDMIVLAPRARGTSNWYTADHAQDDIREAIDDVVANYAVDPRRIVLSGFSMGGYGVYRTFKEDPKRFRGLAVFSGIPRVPGSPSDAPDFLEKEGLSRFREIPLFIFHGGKDRNCPIEQTRALVSRLEQAGAKVDFHYEEEKGHETPGTATLKAFQDWVGKLNREAR